MFEYTEVYRGITYDTAILIFMKKNGDIRIMLGTRNLKTVELKYGFQGRALGGHDNRCNINNGNIAVFDMMLGETRSFNISRLIHFQPIGLIDSNEKLDEASEIYSDFKEKYEAEQPTKLDMDMLD